MGKRRKKSSLEWKRWWKQAQRELRKVQRQVRKAPPQLIGGLAVLLGVALVLGIAIRSLRSAEAETTSQSSNTAIETLSNDPWSYFHPAWKTGGPWAFFTRATRGELLNSRSEIRRLVNDPEDRIEREFKVPEALRDRVAFWMEIYSRYSSKMRVVHDRSNPALIYGHFDFRPLYRVMGRGVPAEVKANEIERKVLKELKAKLLEATGATNTRLLSAGEKDEIQELLSRGGALSARQAPELVANVRSQTGQSDMFLSALYRSRLLLPHIESVFRRHGLPVGLGRIPFVESSFNERALSKTGAVGIWQFMPETAREMISSSESQWSDPLRQTSSAARMLRMYRSVLPDWGTTVTSYNSGVGRVRRLVEKHRLKDVDGLLKLPQNDGLGFAGQNFYSEFLAANIVEAYKRELFEKLIEPADFNLVFKGEQPFPSNACDL